MKRILIVDDERIVLEVLEKMISQLGYHTTVSETGTDALQKFKRKTFDLVMVDLLLPGISGWDLIQKLRKYKPEQKIVLVTGMGSDYIFNEHKFNENNVEDVLLKPFTFNKLRSVLESLN